VGKETVIYRELVYLAQQVSGQRNRKDLCPSLVAPIYMMETIISVSKQ
jgi:hypothetical protein